MELRVGISQAAIEQWGYQTVHGTNPVTYDLPIPFEEAPFTVAISTGNSGNHASCGGFTKTTIVLRAGTTAGVWDTVGFFIIGCQLQWGMMVNQATTFTYPIAFSSNNVLAFKQAKSNSNGNNYLMREAGIGIPNNISVSLPGTSPALSFYVFVIGW